MDNELKEFLQQQLSELVISVGVLEGGEVNKTYLLTTITQKVVARINSIDELPRFEKEKWCMEQVAETSVKTPIVLDIGSFNTSAYMLISYIEGMSGDRIDNTQDVWFVLGSYARKIHSITSQGFGEKLSDIRSSMPGAWSNYLDDNISALHQDSMLIHKDILSSDQAHTLQSYFRDLQKIDLQFGLSHGDLSLSNVIVEKNGSVNLIDWGSAESHVVPHYDLGVILVDSLHEDSDNFKKFLKGYGLTEIEFNAIKDQIKSLMLLIAIDKVRWAIDRNPERLPSAVNHFNKMYNWKLNFSPSALPD